MRRKMQWSRLFAAFLLLAASAQAFGMWWRAQRAPRLEWISSMPVELDGVVTHVRLQVPDGWSDMLPDTGPDEVYGPRHMTIRIVPFRRRSLFPTWLPGWIRSYLAVSKELHAEIEIDVGKQKLDCAEQTHAFTVNYGGMTGYGIERVVSEGVGYRIRYLRTNRSEFEATYRRICESFRVVR